MNMNMVAILDYYNNYLITIHRRSFGGMESLSSTTVALSLAPAQEDLACASVAIWFAVLLLVLILILVSSCTIELENITKNSATGRKLMLPSLSCLAVAVVVVLCAASRSD
jgi:hypothetical protein